MKILPQISLFDHTQIEILGDLERLKLVIENVPDSKLIDALEKQRRNGRNDNPIVPMWHAFLASFVFQHPSIEALRRELSRNPTLRRICGFDDSKVVSIGESQDIYNSRLVPSSGAFSNFIKSLQNNAELIKEMFDELVNFMYDNLPDFGKDVGEDGKAINSFANQYSKKEEVDGRRDLDANFGVKTYYVNKPNGEVETKKKIWFGYKLHLFADLKYELPIHYTITKASSSEQKELKNHMDYFAKNNSRVLDVAENLVADKGYDSEDIITELKSWGINAIIDIRNMWKDGEETRQYRETDLVYTFDGIVYYVNEKGEKIELSYKGYDKERDCLKYGFKPQHNDNRIFRIELSEDERVFTTVGRSSHKWKRLYNKRSGLERINGRLDRDYGFEIHTIRGQKKMEVFCGIGFIVMLSMAKGCVLKNEVEKVGRLINVA